jgi:hypothetical protein
MTVFGCGRVLHENEAPSPQPSSCKPIPPFNLSTTLSNDSRRLTAWFFSKIEGDLTLRVKLSDGVTLTRGEPWQTRRVNKNEIVELPLDIFENGTTREEVLITATLSAGTARFTKTVSVVFNEDDSQPIQKGEFKKNSRGESILEFRAR